ncbi:MAG TPA: response regulator [Gammaproteobacteria bacterium]
MPTPIVICDDSSFARKQMLRALPDGCDVDVTFARDGAEGLAAIKAGKAEIIFLDLNMPVMDGYQALAAIREAGLSPKIIVVSGDIQPDAHKRVMELGVDAFIRKPVDKQEVADVLTRHGVKLSKRKRVKPIAIDTDVRAGCQEVANVAMGRAADLLARLLNVYIHLPIPNVNTIEKNELRMTLKYIDQSEAVSAVCQGFIGAGIAGEALLIFDDASFADMAELMNFQENLDDAVELELLMDMSSILISAFLKGIAEQLDVNFSQGHPIVLGRHVKVDDLLKRSSSRWERTLAIEVSFTFESQSMTCDLLFLFTEDSIAPLYELISYLMPE